MCKKQQPWSLKARLTKTQFFEQLRIVAMLIIGLAFVSWVFIHDLRQLSRAVWLGATVFMGIRYVKNFGLDFLGLDSNHDPEPKSAIIEDTDVL
ncbi:MAG: hypothetical protein AAGF87_08090 [Bacteroidota bacterium]